MAETADYRVYTFKVACDRFGITGASLRSRMGRQRPNLTWWVDDDPATGTGETLFAADVLDAVIAEEGTRRSRKGPEATFIRALSPSAASGRPIPVPPPPAASGSDPLTNPDTQADLMARATRQYEAAIDQARAREIDMREQLADARIQIAEERVATAEARAAAAERLLAGSRAMMNEIAPGS